MAEPAFWSQHDAVREYTALARSSEALFMALGALAPHLEDARAAVGAATIARRLGAHAAAWQELVPESVLLAEARDAAPAAATVAPEWGAVHEAITALRADLGRLLADTSPVADGTARRLAREVLADLEATSG
jgi:hypothetical protein